MLHVGIGEAQMSSLMSAMNIPSLSTKSLKRRVNEAGLGMEKVAKISCEMAIKQEKDATSK